MIVRFPLIILSLFILGAEAAELAVKIARRWGYCVKEIPNGKAVVVFAKHNYMDRTLGGLSASTNQKSRAYFGPYMPGFHCIPFNDVESMEEALKKPEVCAFMIEPIQGHAGVIIPQQGYLKCVRELCKRHNVLWIADEIETGMGRTGKLLCVDYECVQPDILVIGKALGGGFLPISAVLASKQIMDLLKPGSHSLTFGGNPLASRVAIESLHVLKEECIEEHADKMGEKFRHELRCCLDKKVIPSVRGKGLLNALSINPSKYQFLYPC